MWQINNDRHDVGFNKTYFGKDYYQQKVDYTMDIILVKQETKTVDKDSDVLAQKNLEGGGEIEEVIEPTTSVKPSLSESKQHVIDNPSLQEELLHHHDVEIDGQVHFLHHHR